jgi:curved DNA-binding protein CbpA
MRALLLLLLLRAASSNHYDTLGVDRRASHDEVRRAYRKAALECHPDRVVGASDRRRADAEARFKLVGAAYETLSSERKRAEYDNTIAIVQRAPYSRGAASPFDAPMAQPPIAATLVVRCSLEELFRGASKPMRVRGLIDLLVVLRPEWENGHAFTTLSPDGRFVRVVIAVRRHGDLSRRGGDLYATRVITRGAAAKGVPLRVRTLDGRICCFTPPRTSCWRDGQRLAWRGAGMWTETGVRGSVVLTVRVRGRMGVLGDRVRRVITSRAFLRVAQLAIILAKVDTAIAIARSCGQALRALAAQLTSPGARGSKRGFWPRARRKSNRWAR